MDFSLGTWQELSLHAMMGAIIMAQIMIAWQAIKLVKDHVIPIARNHFAHVEDAFERMIEQGDQFHQDTKARIEVVKNQTAVIESQGDLLRELLRNIEKRSQE